MALKSYNLHGFEISECECYDDKAKTWYDHHFEITKSFETELQVKQFIDESKEALQIKKDWDKAVAESESIEQSYHKEFETPVQVELIIQ